MKNIVLVMFCFISYVTLQAQIDTVLFQDFQIDVFQLMDDGPPTGDNVNWVNYDQDGIPTNFGTEETLKWFGGEALVNAIDTVTGETNFVALSVSFLEDFAPGNRNWMILNKIEITDQSYMLHWKSAPGQMPRYMDGYSVLISTDGNEISSFTESLFKAASMEDIVGDAESTDFSNFTFTDGYQHADGGTNPAYFVEGTTVNFGILEPHSVDLSAYAGQSVYIAFLHDSDDDERIQIDDILITKDAEITSTSEELVDEYRMEFYPNPVDQFMNLNFRLDTKHNISYSIYSAQGKLVNSIELGNLVAGTYVEKINMSALSAGIYTIQLEVDDKNVVKSFVKK